MHDAPQVVERAEWRSRVAFAGVSFYLAYGCYELMGAWGETWEFWRAYIRPTNEAKIST